ncbi:MAG: alpha/beta fold hydrolase [Rhodopseudomonas sp.]|nr:alpha/beta fold hydrolase [Rhodopseudomonas sp.]
MRWWVEIIVSVLIVDLLLSVATLSGIIDWSTALVVAPPLLFGLGYFIHRQSVSFYDMTIRRRPFDETPPLAEHETQAAPLSPGRFEEPVGAAKWQRLPSSTLGNRAPRLRQERSDTILLGSARKKTRMTSSAKTKLRDSKTRLVRRPALINREVRAVDLLFASNRVSDTTSAKLDLTGGRGDKLTFGAAQVHVPHDHKIGKLELPLKANWLKLRWSDEATDPQRHFIVEQIGFFDRDRFVELAKANPRRTAVVFVHGFNTSFREGLLRLAQIVWDLQFLGVPVLFSWPSQGGFLSYVYDFNSALGARDSFQELIDILRSQAGIAELHVIAHSMGNLVVLDALSGLVSAGQPTIAELIMAAPDVDIDLFQGLIKKVGQIVRGMTLYASANDWAMKVSRDLSKKPRAGDVFETGPVVAQKLDSIDVSAIGNEMFGLNHNTFASNRSLVDDIGRLIAKGDRPPNARSPQIRGVPEGKTPPAYWKYVD